MRAGRTEAGSYLGHTIQSHTAQAPTTVMAKENTMQQHRKQYQEYRERREAFYPDRKEMTFEEYLEAVERWRREHSQAWADVKAEMRLVGTDLGDCPSFETIRELEKSSACKARSGGVRRFGEKGGYVAGIPLQTRRLLPPRCRLPSLSGGNGSTATAQRIGTRAKACRHWCGAAAPG